MTIVNKTCMECGKQFEYDEKPDFPRKYCFSCGAKKKASYAEKEKVEVAKPHEQKKTSQDGSKSTAMYVSYAKDIFGELLRQNNVSVEENRAKETMQLAIDLVKQARDSF